MRRVVSTSELRVFVTTLGVIATLCSAVWAQTPAILNPGFEDVTTKSSDDARVAQLSKIGWKFGDPIVWPNGWSLADVSNVTFGTITDKPHSGTRCIELWGEAGSSGYLGATVTGLRKATYKISFWGRGMGTATMMTSGMHLVLNRRMSEYWRRCSGTYRNTAGLSETSLTLQAQGSPVFFDDLSIEECDALEEMRIRLESELSANNPDGKDSFSYWDLAGQPEGSGAQNQQPAEEPGYQADLDAALQTLPRLKTLVQADPIPNMVQAISLLGTRVNALKQVSNPTLAQMNDAVCYRMIAEKLLKELDFTDAEEGK